MGAEKITEMGDYSCNTRPYVEKNALAGIALTLVTGGKELLHEETREIHPVEYLKRIGGSVLERVTTVARF